MLLLKNGLVVTGDGRTMYEKGSVLIDNEGDIAYVGERIDSQVEAAAEVVDCTGKAIMPGMINHHQHGVTYGPIFASGLKNYGKDRIQELLDRNLLQGHTTVMNVDGFATMEEVEATQADHPIRIKTATTHLPINYQAALECDGKGLSLVHEHMTAQRMIERGAVCIGEVGGGHTLGGGGQDYLYIPKKVKEVKGIDIDYMQARMMKLAVLGRFIEKSYYNRDIVAAALKEAKLDSVMTPEECRDIIWESTYASVQVALNGYSEAAKEAIRLDVPLMCHNAPTSMKRVHEVAKMGVKHFIACHSNYLFTTEEAVENGKFLHEHYGVILDAAVHDPFGQKHLVATPDNLFAFYENDLIDVLSTDFANGQCDSMLKAIEEAVKRNLVSLPKAVAQGTTNVTEALPRIAPRLGLLAPGYIADVIVVNNPNFSEVQRIYIGGKLIVKDGVKVCNDAPTRW